MAAQNVADREHDVVVIGSGPGGEGAAMKAAKSGLSVVMVDRYLYVGGGCTHWATIPSKALRQSVREVLEFRRNPLFAELSDNAQFTFPQLLQAANRVVRKQVTMRRDFYLRNHVPVLHGTGRFVDAHTLEVTGEDRAATLLRAKAFVLAVGSRPYRPADVDFTHPRIRDSDTILGLNDTPGIITIYGAGVVGCEYASIFRSLGVKVNLVHSRDKLLDFLDDEIIDALSYHLRELGVVIRHNEEYTKVETTPHGVVLHLKSGKRIKSDVLLWAQGRSGNTDLLNLEALGVKPNGRGQLKVDAHYRLPEQPHVYAVGDVVGAPSLASASYDQGRFAATHLTDPKTDFQLVQNIPVGIYTSPEISSLGRTERELTAAGVPYEVGHTPFRSLARAQITGNTVGMLKLLFHRETLELLGIHCFGDQASEIVHIGQAIMSQKGGANTIEYFVNTTFNYPTMAEAYRVAALNGMNRLS
ncbi:Si-specific NAD(P)(+) transhydrogenase [Aggregicoccus sp. 17bor-14]|uniref:Si-specific NAD(P)(+) transhydrogenase n=1 Tax=Myxococcaceae TaxID=31 RepID=UPI0012F32607|nr:Si-specific NAD(P)(+) transhydrogenase [Simulacricoccus sp. 17bor-14]MRI90269.1 Si-specific NAD(P)(+) transhydrogenase [Aggregicoccus sp. 17bor-14]